MTYIPHTRDDIRKMLDRIGVSSVGELLQSIPDHLRLDRPLEINQTSEMELLREISDLAAQGPQGLTSFAGGGVYDQFIPAAVDAITSRPEFMTAYTPYQPEVSQGTLQVMYEFQTHICRLTGMDVANASMYDGATAAAEAAVMTMRVTRRSKVVMSETLHPTCRDVVRTYLSGKEAELIDVPMKNGLTDFNRLEDVCDEKTACVLLSQPNFFGLLESYNLGVQIIHKVGGKLVLFVDPVVQALVKPASEYDADIVVGEGQPLGLPVSFGGPLLGFFAAKKELVRSMPGRIAGRTKDVDGREGFTLILQTREQHIRREKATSNICTNQALCATAAAVYMTLLGREGLKQVALLSAERAREILRRAQELDGFEPYFDAPFVREFTLKTSVPAEQVVLSMVDKYGVVPGIDAGRWYPSMKNCLIVAATEKRTDIEVDRLIDGLRELAGHGVLSRM